MAELQQETATKTIVEYTAGLWERKTWKWTEYDKHSSKLLLAAKAKGEPTVNLTFGAAHSYVVDLIKETQTNLLSKKTRKIRFREVLCSLGNDKYLVEGPLDASLD